MPQFNIYDGTPEISLNIAYCCSRMTEEFYPELYEKFNPETCANSLEQLMNNPMGKVIIAVSEDKIVGMIGVYAINSLFSDHIVAEELIWWVDPDYRQGGVGQSLLDEAEFWASTINADVFFMACKPGTPVELLLKKRGFVPRELKFKKDM